MPPSSVTFTARILSAAGSGSSGFGGRAKFSGMVAGRVLPLGAMR